MKLFFLGTGAADWPDPGEHVGAGRRFCSTLVNDTLLLDCNAMTPAAMTEFRIDVNRITDIVIGHPHRDHYSPEGIFEIVSRRDPALSPPTLHLNGPAAEDLRRRYPDVDDIITIKPYLPGDCIECTNFRITSFLANHMDGKNAAQLFIESEANETLLYALDGAWLLRQTFEFLRTRKLDAVIWDLTSGDNPDWRLFEHCNLDMVKLMTQTFRFTNILKPESRLFCSHTARTLCPPQEEFAPYLASQGYELAYDGLCVTF